MKFISTMSTALAASAIAGTAFAADLPSRRAPVIVAPVPVMTWAGLYVGLNAGYTFSESSNVATSGFGTDINGLGNGGVYAAAAGALSTFNANPKQRGFIGGGQIGYNWQFGSFVTGLEADIQHVAGGAKSSPLLSAAFPVGGEGLGQFAIVERGINYLGTVRGRFGFTVTPTFLLYATGGLAYGGLKSSTAIEQQIFGAGAVVNPGFGYGSSTKTRIGYTVGAGGEWMFSPNWSAKIEYMYYDLGRSTYAVAPVVISTNGGTPFISATAATSQRTNGHIVRAGLNYHFNWGAAPVVARY